MISERLQEYVYAQRLPILYAGGVTTPPALYQHILSLKYRQRRINLLPNLKL
jgi:hypothetical protein